MLPLQQLMKGLGLRGPVGPGPVGCKALIDCSRTAVDGCDVAFERRCAVASGIIPPGVALGDRQQILPGAPGRWRKLTRDCFEDIAVAFRRDRQPVLEIPR